MKVINQFNSAEDLLLNTSFREWVLKKGDTASNAFWNKWAMENTHQSNSLNTAKAIILSVAAHNKSITDEELEAEIKAIQKRAVSLSFKTENNFGKSENKNPVFSMAKKVAGIAAIFVLAAGLWYFLQSAQSSNTAVSSYENFNKANNDATLEYINNTDTVQSVSFPDGSTALLSKKSKLSYVNEQVKNFYNRAVYLEGEAFFNVTKNPDKPFIVYTNDIVTKVLGTSFRVKAYGSDKQSTVIVKTGKVSVYKKKNFDKALLKPNALTDGLLITPNQQAIYNNEVLQKSIVDKPVVAAPVLPGAFEFYEAPLADVLAKLEDSYCIHIIYDKEIIASCSITAKLGTESFYDKLKLLCKSVNATYEIVDGNVVITSHGCN